MVQQTCAKIVHFFIPNSCFFPLQNHRFLSSQCIDGLQKLNKSCKKSSLLIQKSSFFDEKSTCSPLSICKWTKQYVQKSFIFHSKMTEPCLNKFHFPSSHSTTVLAMPEEFGQGTGASIGIPGN